MPFDDFGSGNPVLLIHAFPLSRTMWNEQAELLASSGFRVILPDLPGFGENNSVLTSFTDIAGQIIDLLEFLGINRAVIGGLSMGGYVAFNLFHLSPEKFSGLILCDTTHRADTDEKRKSRFELISKIEKHGSAALIENLLPNLISDHTKENNPLLLSSLEETFSQVNLESAVNALRAMAERRDNSDIIGKIKVPTLLIFGESDKITNLESAREMNSLIPGSELKIIENAGHYSNLEQPSEFNDALLSFCQRTEF